MKWTWHNTVFTIFAAILAVGLFVFLVHKAAVRDVSPTFLAGKRTMFVQTCDKVQMVYTLENERLHGGSIRCVRPDRPPLVDGKHEGWPPPSHGEPWEHQ